MWCFFHWIWLWSKFILWRGQKRRHVLDTRVKKASKQSWQTVHSHVYKHTNLIRSTKSLALSNAFYHKNEEKKKVNRTHRYNRGWAVCVYIQIPKLSTLLFDCYAITAGQTDLSLSSCMLRIKDAILFLIKGWHAKVNVRPVMPFQMFFALARSGKGHLTNAIKAREWNTYYTLNPRETLFMKIYTLYTIYRQTIYTSETFFHPK